MLQSLITGIWILRDSGFERLPVYHLTIARFSAVKNKNFAGVRGFLFRLLVAGCSLLGGLTPDS